MDESERACIEAGIPPFSRIHQMRARGMSDDAIIAQLVMAPALQSGLIDCAIHGVLKHSFEAIVLEFPNRFTTACQRGAKVKLHFVRSLDQAQLRELRVQ
jgi:hypothetical protein